MLKNQRGMTVVDTIVFITILLFCISLIFYVGRKVGQEEAMGTPIQFKELEKNVSYTLMEKLPSSNNLSIIRQMEGYSEEFSQKVVVGLPPKIQIHDEFILREEDKIFLKE